MQTAIDHGRHTRNGHHVSAILVESMIRHLFRNRSIFDPELKAPRAGLESQTLLGPPLAMPPQCGGFQPYLAKKPEYFLLAEVEMHLQPQRPGREAALRVPDARERTSTGKRGASIFTTSQIESSPER